MNERTTLSFRVPAGEPIDFVADHKRANLYGT